MTNQSNQNRQYVISPALSLTVCGDAIQGLPKILRDKPDPDFEASAKDFMSAYFRFLHELTNVTYHGKFLPHEEQRLRELFEKLIQSRGRLG